MVPGRLNRFSRCRRNGRWPAAWERHLTIVKLAPDGSEAARYPGEVVDVNSHTDSWIVVHADLDPSDHRARRLRVSARRPPAGVVFAVAIGSMRSVFTPRAISGLVRECDLSRPSRPRRQPNSPDLARSLCRSRRVARRVVHDPRRRRVGSVRARIRSSPRFIKRIVGARAEFIRRFERGVSPVCADRRPIPINRPLRKRRIGVRDRCIQNQYTFRTPPLTCPPTGGNLLVGRRKDGSCGPADIAPRVGLSGLRWAQGRA